MKLNKKQEQELNEFIREGIAHLSASEINIKKYLAGIHDWLQRMYDDAQEEAYWPIFFLSESKDQDCKKRLDTCIKLLQDIRFDIDNKKQIQSSRCANVISIFALVIALILPVFLTTQCSNTIKFDEKQLEQYEAVVSMDSVNTIVMVDRSSE